MLSFLNIIHSSLILSLYIIINEVKNINKVYRRNRYTWQYKKVIEKLLRKYNQQSIKDMLINISFVVLVLDQW